jgi:hypothetical protein
MGMAVLQPLCVKGRNKMN